MSDPIENTAAPAKPPSRLRRYGRKLLALLISTLIALFVAELVIRWVAPQVMTVPMFEGVGGLQLHRANLDGRASIPRLFDVTYHTNSQRFRSQREFSIEPLTSASRIIATGDSFCFGIGAEDQQTFPEVLERSLLKSGKTVEVINAGVCGSGTGSQALWFDMALSQFKPKVVVLSVFVNDIEDDLASPFFTLDSAGKAIPLPEEQRIKRDEPVERARRRVNRIPGYSFLAQHSHLVNFLRRMGSLSMGGGKQQPKTDDQMMKLHQRFMAEGVPLFDAELRWLKYRVESSGAKLVVAWFPTRETIYPDAGPDAEESRWQAKAILAALNAFSAKEDVSLFEPTAVFKQKAASVQEELFFKGADRHAKPDGYRLFGEELSGFLLKSGVLTNPR